MKRKPESWHAENDPATALSSRTQSASAGPGWFTSTIGSTSRRVMFAIETGPGPILVSDSGRVMRAPGSTRPTRTSESKTLAESVVQFEKHLPGAP